MKKLLSATAMLLASTVYASAEGELQLFNWGDYTNPELLEKVMAHTPPGVLPVDSGYLAR